MQMDLVYKTFGCDVSSVNMSHSWGSGVRYNNGWCTTSDVSTNPVQQGVWHASVRQIAQGGWYGRLVYAVNSFPALTVETARNASYVMNFDAGNNVISVGNGRQSGGWVGGSDWYNGDLAEILVYNKQLTQAQMEEMLIHLNLKYKLYYSPGDFEPDKDVDVDDLAVLAAQWLSSGSDLIADIHPSEGDGVVNLADLAEFARHWMIVVE